MGKKEKRENQQEILSLFDFVFVRISMQTKSKNKKTQFGIQHTTQYGIIDFRVDTIFIFITEQFHFYAT